MKKKGVQKNEKQNENEEQKESLDKTAKALSFCGESGTEMEPEISLITMILGLVSLKSLIMNEYYQALKPRRED